MRNNAVYLGDWLLLMILVIINSVWFSFSFSVCFFWCVFSGDNLDNINVNEYEIMSQAAAHITYALATRHIVEGGEGRQKKQKRTFDGSASNRWTI